MSTTTATSTTMNTRTFHESLQSLLTSEPFLSMCHENPTLEEQAHKLFDYSNDQLIKLDEKNARAKSKPSKTQTENEPIKAAILDLLTSTPTTEFTQSELGDNLSISGNKAGALARQLVAEGLVQVREVKLPKVGPRKVYSIVTEPAQDSEISAN